MYESSTDDYLKPTKTDKYEKADQLDITPHVYDEVNNNEKTDSKWYSYLNLNH